jgi:hypothetical protein
MNITDPEMLRKMEKALKLGGNLYTLDDIQAELMAGNIQGHVEGDTWAITQIQLFPRRKVVNIMFVIGSISNAAKLEEKISKWAKELGANMITATGRDGWWAHRTPGWKMMGILYSKDM